jgi:hypothetical protein
LTFEGPSLPLSLEKKPGIANAGGGGVSRRNAFGQGTGWEKSRGSAMRRLQTAGRKLYRPPRGYREAGRHKMQMQIVSGASVRAWIVDLTARVEAEKRSWELYATKCG